ncbi:1592_t:CDS:2 [Funneliformis mosseae]|uniref:1592_t:CDS:1 n=1 Tax=Funneliformis mosseae TaxID=27381 RepID=A0A9N9A5F3_FUNMO|nr:1592_t:CDS:2 [Funneliformis mosseae]
MNPPNASSVSLYRQILRYLRSSSFPFKYLRPKIHYNVREMFEIYRNERDNDKIKMLLRRGWQDIEFLKSWEIVEKEIRDDIFRGFHRKF